MFNFDSLIVLTGPEIHRLSHGSEESRITLGITRCQTTPTLRLSRLHIQLVDVRL
jgi:hypothetical protein